MARNWYDKVSGLEREARYRLNRNRDHSWGVTLPYDDGVWKVDIYRPRKYWWAKAVAWNKKPEQCMTHVIKTQVTATHKKTGSVFVKTTWLCGSSTFVKPVKNPNPIRGCAKCYSQTQGVFHGEVKL
jgi:hypothetical protein